MRAKSTLRKIVKNILLENYKKSNTETNSYIVYHGTNDYFEEFESEKTCYGVFWFTDSVESIKKGTHGGEGSKYIMKREIVLSNPAGWDEYENFSLEQLKNVGFDGVILPEEDKTDYIVFNKSSIKKL